VVQGLIDANSTWTTLRQAFVTRYTLVDPFVRVVDEVLALRQGHDEPPGAYFDRLTGTLAKGEMVDSTLDSKWIKLLLPLGVRAELLPELRRVIHLPLHDIDKALTTEAYAKKLTNKSSDAQLPAQPAQPSSTNQLLLSDKPPLNTPRQVHSNPDEKVNHTVNNYDNKPDPRKITCFFCGKLGHTQRECRTKQRLLESVNQPREKRQYHPYKKNNNNNNNNKHSRREDDSDDEEEGGFTNYNKKGSHKSSNTKVNRKAVKAFHGAHNYTVTEELSPVNLGPTSELLRVAVVIAGKSVQALVDTGATVSLFNTRVAPIDPDRTLFSGRVWINTAVDGMRSEALGYARLPVRMEGISEEMKHKFLLTTKSKEDVILGLDFLKEQGFIIDPVARCLLKRTTQGTATVVLATAAPNPPSAMNVGAHHDGSAQQPSEKPSGKQAKATDPLPGRQQPTGPSLANQEPTTPTANQEDTNKPASQTGVQAPASSDNRTPPTEPREYQLFAVAGTTVLPDLTQSIDLQCKVPLQPGYYATRDSHTNSTRRFRIAEQIVEVEEPQLIRLRVTIQNDSSFPIAIRPGERLMTLDPIGEAIVHTGLDVHGLSVDGEEIADLSHLDSHQRQILLQAIKQNKGVFHQKDSELHATHLTQHQIHVKEGSDPVFTPQYPLPFAHQDVVKRLVLEMLEQRIVEPTRSAYNSPIILVKKHDGTWRFVTDFRRLNNVTIPDRFPLARQDDIFRDLQGMLFYTTFDLKHGFWQIEIVPSDRHYTAFSVAGLGQFQYCRLPFGLSNSPATFCRVVTTAIAGSANLMEGDERVSIARAYVDDIIIASKDFDSHVTHINIILSALHEANLTIHPGKCTWAKPEIKFLGHIVDRNGIRLDPERVRRISEWQPPTNRRALLRFIGFVNFCRMFVPRFGALCHPLYMLTSKNKDFNWDEEHQEAFESVKHAMQSAETLAIPIYDGRPFLIECDASNYGIGAALLQQQDDGSLRPIAFAGRALKPQEETYGISEKECMAMVYALQQFNIYTAGHKVEIKTDHAALTWLQDKVRLGNRRLQLWSLILQRAFPEIKYSPGETMVLADALSRCDEVENPEEYLAGQAHPLPAKPTQHFINSLNVVQQNFCHEQRQDQNLREIIDFIHHGVLPNDKQRRLRIQQQSPSYHMNNNLLYKGSKLVVPRPLREKLLIEAHDSPLGGHLSESKTLSKLQPYYWKGMTRDARRHISACKSCGGFKDKIGQSKPRLVQQVPEPYEPFSEINIDMITNLPKTKSGNQHILTLTDKMSRWVEAYPLPDLTAASVANTILQEFVCRYGAPIRICSDRGSNFTAELFGKVAQIINSQQQLSPAYCPWVNGSVERMNGTLVRMLRHYVNSEQDDWDEKLPFVLFAYRSSVNRTTGFSPFRLVYGHEARGPTEASIKASATSTTGSPDEVKTYMSRLSKTMAEAWTHAKAADTTYRQSDDDGDSPPSNDFAVGDQVWVYQPDNKSKSKKFAEDWVPGWVIKSVLSPQVFVVQRGDGLGRNDVRTVHEARVKPYNESKSVDVSRKRRVDSPTATTDAPQAKRKPVIHTIMDRIVGEATDDAGKIYYVTRWFGLTSDDDTLEPEQSFALPGGGKSPILTRWLRKKRNEQRQDK